MESDSCLIIKKFKEDFQKIVAQNNENFTYGDIRSIERALHELGNIERKIHLVHKNKKLAV